MLIKQGKTNIKYLLIVVILAGIVGGGLFIYQKLWLLKQETNEELLNQKTKEPYIEVIFPNGGEELKLDREYTMKWESSGIDFVNIYLREIEKTLECYLNEEPISAELGSYTIKLDKFKCMGGTGKVSPEPIRIEESDKYTINIVKTPYEPYYEIGDKSDGYFSISEDETADWEIYRNEEGGYEFRYPKDFNQKYIREHDWPPKVTVRHFDPNFFCENLESVKTPIGYGKQQEVVLNGSKYCVLIVSESTAGTSYVTYNYVTEKNDKHLTLEFILKFLSCGALYGINNKMEECEEERENFNPINIVDQIISTFRFLE